MIKRRGKFWDLRSMNQCSCNLLLTVWIEDCYGAWAVTLKRETSHPTSSPWTVHLPVVFCSKPRLRKLIVKWVFVINYYLADNPVVQPRHDAQPCHATRKRNLKTIYFFVFRHEEDAEECLSIYAHRVITVTRVRGRRHRNEAHSIRGPENRITRHTSNFECSFNRQLVAMCLPRFYFERQYCMLEFASIRQEEHALQSAMSEFRYELDDNVLL